MTPTTTPPLSAAWLVWGLGALLYLIGFFQRVAPAVMTDELMGAFRVNAAGLGSLSALYFYSYVAMQVPTGILADRLGPRRLLTAGAFTAAIGTLLFALAGTLVEAGAGRLLIGGGVAVAFVGLLKIADTWFPAGMFALVSGVALFIGIVGAVCAGPPLRILMGYCDWRAIMVVAAVITFLIAGGIWGFVRDSPRDKGFAEFPRPGSSASRDSRPGILRGIVEVLRYPNVVLLCLIPGGIVGCVLTFSGLWGVPYLATHRHLSTAEASILSSALMIAWAVGGPVFGRMSDRIGRRKPLYIVGSGVCLAGWVAILQWNDMPMPALAAILTVVGFCSGCIIISFAYAKESVPVNLAGTVSGLINMGVMMGPMILQPAVGWILDLYWAGEMQGGVRVYSLDAYHTAFTLMPGWSVLGFVLLFFTRETRCRQMVR